MSTEEIPTLLEISRIYIVAILEQGIVARYQQFDNSGAVHFTTSINNAKHYNIQQEAVDFVNRLNEESKTGKRIYDAGKRYPSVDVSKALNVRDTVGKKYNGTAVVIEYAPLIVFEQNIYGSIQVPTGYTYDES